MSSSIRKLATRQPNQSLMSAQLCGLSYHCARCCVSAGQQLRPKHTPISTILTARSKAASRACRLFSHKAATVISTARL
jgi:hypothetical protein